MTENSDKAKSNYIIPIFVPDLGCPHQCVFCSQKRITGQISVPTPAQVLNTIQEYLMTIPEGTNIFREVAFFGGSFTAVEEGLQRYLLEPAFRFLASGRIDGIRVSTRPDAISEEGLALLSAYGVSTIELGVQSMDDQVLRTAGRGHTSRDVVRAAALIKSWGINLGFQIMVGLPGDSAEKGIDTVSNLILLQPDMARIYPCLVLKGTPLAELYLSGEYTPVPLEEAVSRCKKLLLMFEQAGIKVIRIGLQPSDQISLEGEVIAGPYHPAFRELVESAAAQDLLHYLLTHRAGVYTAKRVETKVPERDVSIVRGHKGSNAKFLREKFGVTEFITIPDPLLEKGEITLLRVDDREYGVTAKRENRENRGQTLR